jgi:hypothetical protein
VAGEERGESLPATLYDPCGTRSPEHPTPRV